MSLRLSMLGLGLISSWVHAAPTGGAPYEVQQKFVIGGPGGWDYLTVDPRSHRLLISRSDRVLVVDPHGALAATIPDTPGVHGIALAPAIGKGFTSNGRGDSVTEFDLKTFKPDATIDVEGHNPDAILYDPASKHLYTFNGRSEDISVIDPQNRRVLAKLPAGGKPEFAVTDAVGQLFFNIQDKSQLGVIDSSTNTLANVWTLPNCEEPTGLAFDNKHHRLFSVCANGVLVVTDAVTGRHVAEVPIGKGPDAAAFDAARGLVFSSNGQDGTLTVIHEDDPDHFHVVDTVVTQKSARTLALDPATHRVYLVAAQFGEAPAPTEDQPHPRPPVLDNTFTLLIVGN